MAGCFVERELLMKGAEIRGIALAVGLTPLSRSRIRVPGGGAEQDEFVQFLAIG